MAVGMGLLMVAVGAILAFAIDASVSGVDVNAVGVILMVVGIMGLAISMLVMASFAPFYRRSHDTVVHKEIVHR